MRPLSESARLVLDRMEPDRRYDAEELRAFLSEAGIEQVREIMHELWLHRQVERAGHSGWRRHASAPPHAPRPRAANAKAVKPEDLFDHTTFAEFFE